MSDAAASLSDEPFLNAVEQHTLLSLARRSVDRWVRDRARINWKAADLTETLRRNGGCFVTVRTSGQLRGCIGSIVHREPLAQSVRDNAVSAASRDPRFDPIQTEELSMITIEISALTQGDRPGSPFRRVHSIEEIQIGRDGICIEVGERRGLLLPQVAVERRWNREQFLTATCIKAGIEETAWQRSHTVLYRFSAQVFGDA